MSRETMSLRVVKVGGSLLGWPPLPKALRDWLDRQSPAVNVLICGGGQIVDVIRKAAADFSLDEEAAHWLCIDALFVNARLLHEILSETAFSDRFDDFDFTAVEKNRVVIFDPREFLRQREAERPGCVLPHTWGATSDSIAARVAEVLQADELVLLKSATAPANATVADLAACGYVDSHFPRAARDLAQVQMVNLRQWRD
jgi:aspartokinase-like uncharacterized kinase